MESQVIIGYHGCDAELARRLVNGEGTLQASTNDHDWLGHGIYFWEEDSSVALEWAKKQAKRRPGSIRNPCVVGAVITPGHCFNLFRKDSFDLLREAYELYATTCQADRNPMAVNLGDGRRYLDCATMNVLHKLVQSKGQPPIDVIRAYFPEGAPVYPGSGIRGQDHIQICVVNPRMIRGFFLPR